MTQRYRKEGHVTMEVQLDGRIFMPKDVTYCQQHQKLEKATKDLSLKPLEGMRSY
jgi:hypothetical protein